MEGAEEVSVIINGDDFGMNEGCSRAISEALKRGLITHASMMANGEYFAQAAQAALGLGFAQVTGVHFDLTEGAPLTDEIGKVTCFVRDGSFHKGYFSSPRPLSAEEQEAVYRELTAQAVRIKSAGMAAAHADSHHYIHNLEHIAPIAARVCREQGISRVRLIRTVSTPGRPAVTEGRVPNAWWREQGFVTVERFLRLSDIGEGGVPDGSEVMLHPDFDKSGALIDRTGYEDGFAVGEAVPVLISL